MEKEGLVRSTKFLQTNGISINTIITDRHPQIQKYIREEMPSVKHYYDVWHTAKGMLS
jgi:MULE transposase domain